MAEEDGKKSGDYDVGYGKPPKEHRFQPKHTKSKGKRKKRQPSVQSIVEAELLKTIQYADQGKTKSHPALQVIMKRLTNKALMGDDKSIMTALTIAQKHLPQAADEEGDETDLNETERAVLDDVLAMKLLFSEGGVVE